MTLAVNDLLTVFGMALLGRGHLSYLLNNFTLQKMLYTVCEEAASEAYKGTYHLGKGGWPHFRAEVPLQYGCRLQERERRSWGCGVVCMWTATAQLPGTVEAGRAAGPSPAHLGAFAGQLGALNDFASAEENLSGSACIIGLCRPQPSNESLVVGRAHEPSALLAASSALQHRNEYMGLYAIHILKKP